MTDDKPKALIHILGDYHDFDMVIGPFDTEEEAKAWSEKHCKRHLPDWVVIGYLTSIDEAEEMLRRDEEEFGDE